MLKSTRRQGDVVELTAVAAISIGRLHVRPGMWAVRQTEKHQEIVYVSQVVHVQAEDGSQVKLQAFTFSFKQLRAIVTSNSVTVRRARFNEVMDAYTPPADVSNLAEFRPPQLLRGGLWPWRAADLRKWVNGAVDDGGVHGDFRALHLASVSPSSLFFTYR